MIENPWIILRVDRTRLGSGIWAVREAAREGLPTRRTRDPHRAWRFATRRKAENAVKKLAWGTKEGFHPSHKFPNEPTVLFLVSRLDEADLPRPKPEPTHQQLALPFVTHEDTDRWTTA